MTAVPFNYQQANRFLPHIVFVALGIGTANYLMNGQLNWIQWFIQSLTTSFIIGYSLVIIGLNKSWLESYFSSRIKLYLFLLLTFFLVGLLATEIEHYLRSLVFQTETFQPFSSGNMYLFNGIISLVLGFSFFTSQLSKNEITKPEAKPEHTSNQQSKVPAVISKIPVKQGENIILTPLDEIVYFEAFDNYSFVYTLSGEKMLCDYSLLFLEKRLDKKFSRIHRKYIVNEHHIKKIKPHLNGRYVIEFGPTTSPITSSKSYAPTIKKLIKIG